MATRADFYILHTDGGLELLGCTSNDYSGDFETARDVQDYIYRVEQMLKANNSIRGKWYWPWKNSHITDEVFVFQRTPKFLRSRAGKVLSKVYTFPEVDEDKLAFVDHSIPYDELGQNEEGEVPLEKTLVLKLPTYTL